MVLFMLPDHGVRTVPVRLKLITFRTNVSKTREGPSNWEETVKWKRNLEVKSQHFLFPPEYNVPVIDMLDS